MVRSRRITGQLGRWLARRKLGGQFWQVLLLIWCVNCVAAVGMNLTAYLVIWPDAIIAEWKTMIGLPILMVTVLTVPVVYLDYALVRALLDIRRELETEAAHDFLTGVANRRGFEAQMRKMTKVGGAFLLVDLDYFKDVNDNLGHDVGDNVLRSVGQAMRDSVRHSDLVARLGGEEFAIFMPGVDAAQACEISERVRESIAERTSAHLPGGAKLTCSAGLTLSDGGAFQSLYHAADRALYAAKAQGRNRLEVTAPS